jgi:hypothetical protein
MNIQGSRSEDAGIALLTDNDRTIYSVGISTGGVAEMRMAELNRERHIIATTVDEKGAQFARDQVAARGLEDLVKTTAELHRILKPSGKLFVVVRSTECPDAKRANVEFDTITHLTTCTVEDQHSGRSYNYSRFFHTEDSIRHYIEKAGFDTLYTKAYDEQLFIDFMRTETAPTTDNIIELLARKEGGRV